MQDEFSLYKTSNIKLRPIKVPVNSTKMEVNGAILRKDVQPYLELVGTLTTILTTTGEVECLVIYVNLTRLGVQAHTYEIGLTTGYTKGVIQCI